MNTATWSALVAAGICVGGPALLAAGLLAWDRVGPADVPAELVVVDAEDHGPEPTADELTMLHAGVTALLTNPHLGEELRAVDDLRLPDDLKRRIRARVLAGERLADVYNTALDQEREA